MDRVSGWEVAWHGTQASQVADVLDIVQCGQPRGKGYLQAHRNTRLVAGASPELVVWLKSSLLEAGKPGLPLLLAAGVWSGLDRELGLTELGHRVLPHKFCTLQAVGGALAAAAAGIASLQQIEALALAAKVRVASLGQVPWAIYHRLPVWEADLVEVVRRRPPRGEVVQPVAPAPTESALLAVLGWIPGLRIRRSLTSEGTRLFFGMTVLHLPGLDYLLLVHER